MVGGGTGHRVLLSGKRGELGMPVNDSETVKKEYDDDNDNGWT